MLYDVVVVGGGIVGTVFACALAQQTQLSIAILEARAEDEQPWVLPSYYYRVSAIALSSQRIFQSLGIWNHIKDKRLSPFTTIQIWDDREQDNLEFDCQNIAESVLGFIIENNLIQEALTEKRKKYSQIHYFSPIKLTAINESAKGIEVHGENEQVFKTRLVIAADGANSWTRQAAGIEIDTEDYDQEAIVAAITTALPHKRIARQVFLGEGPLAFLPLQDANTSSIVWSLPSIEAKRLMTLKTDAFGKELEQAFSHRLGEVLTVGNRYSFPLRKHIAKQYVKSRIVLLGDAAHTVHPLAGQGVNIGLLDATSLAEIIAEGVNHRRDFSSPASLRRFERWRKADNLTIIAGIDFVKNIFANNMPSIRKLRSLGLSITKQTQWIKNTFIRQAVGDRSGLPMLANKIKR